MQVISLTRGKQTIVDDEDYELLKNFKWHAAGGKAGKFYAARSKRRRKQDGSWGSYHIMIHRLLMGSPNDREIDYINGDSLDNRRENLRLCTHRENIRNGKKRYGSSKYKGVSWHKRDLCWEAYIKVEERIVYLGRFDKEVDAAKAYNDAAKKYFKEFSNLNII